MIHATSRDLARQYAKAARTVQAWQVSVKNPVLADTPDPQDFLGADGQELLSRLKFLRKLKGSTFAHRKPYIDNPFLPRLAIVTTIMGRTRSRGESPLVLFIEKELCYVGYQNEEGRRDALGDKWLTLVTRDQEGQWVETVMMEVMKAAIKTGTTPRLACANPAP